MAFGYKTGGRTKGTPNKVSREFQEALELFMSNAIEEIPQLYDRLSAKEKIEYFIKLSPYITPKKQERFNMVEDVAEQPLFITNTMVVTSERYKELKESGRLDDDGNYTSWYVKSHQEEVDSEKEDYESKYYYPLFYQIYDLIKSKYMKTPEKVIDKSYKPVYDIWTKLIKMMRAKKANMFDIYKLLLDMVSLKPGTLKNEFGIEAMNMYVKDLERIIKNSPKLDKKMIVYRGVDSDYFMEDRKLNVYFKNKNFLSTSLNPAVALHFSFEVNPDYNPKKRENCCISEITLLPGTRCIWISGMSEYPAENEVLLNNGTTYLIRSNKVEYIVDPGNAPLKKTEQEINDVEEDVINDVCTHVIPKKTTISSIVAL